MFYILTILLCIIYFLVCLHFFQWKSYFKLRYLKYLLKNRLIIINNLILIIAIISYFISTNFLFILFLHIFSLILLFCFLFKKKKIKFIFTERLFRVFFINIFILFILTIIGKLVLIIYTILTPIGVVLCDLFDIKKLIIDNQFLNSATTRLEHNKPPIVIGITGSNGKTTTKEILAHILSAKFKVYTTHQNQNTLKGAILALNNMPPNTEIFVCEMGARQVGDIKSICDFVGINIGIISSVSAQHLETFKTLENIYKTKKELPDHLQEKLCAFNLDNELSKKMFDEKNGEKLGISVKTTADIYASNILIQNFKTQFTLHYKGNTYTCETQLLGEHNVTNILLASSIALQLGISIPDLIKKIRTIPPTPHRLQYIKSHIDILDDTYNCSFDSATKALKVLATSTKHKVVCTPGIVEGGKKQFELNSKLSQLLNIADTLIIVGKTNKKSLKSNLNNFEKIEIKSKKIFGKLNTEKIYKNIKSNTKKCAYFVTTLEIAKVLFSKILNSNSILLLLNDLPDEYS